MTKTTPPRTDADRGSKREQGRTDAAKPDPADKLVSNTPSTDVDGGRISSADGRFVADHRPSR